MKITAKKSLGQHFLHSQSVLEKIVNAGEISPDDTILEIGPGTGFLTEALLNSPAKYIIAVEKDERSIDLLKEKFTKELEIGRLNVVSGDILDLDLSNIAGHYKIIANIPYYITGAILEKFLTAKNQPQIMILLVQKEIATRILALDKKESLLSVSVKVYGSPKVISRVGRGAFSPPPNVDSAVLAIMNITKEALSSRKIEESYFFSLIRAGFAHKRKILRSNLTQILTKEQVDDIWNTVNLSRDIRAEDLTLSQWIEMAETAKKMQKGGNL